MKTLLDIIQIIMLGVIMLLAFGLVGLALRTALLPRSKRGKRKAG